MSRINFLRTATIMIASLSAAFALPAQINLKTLESEKAFTSDDGSLIKSMSSVGNVQSVHCALPPKGVIRACRHKTVSQIWYVLAGRGEMWLADLSKKENAFVLAPGTSFSVPLGYSFQFRNTGDKSLEIFIVNTTPWSGPGELIPVNNHWN